MHVEEEQSHSKAEIATCSTDESQKKCTFLLEGDVCISKRMELIKMQQNVLPQLFFFF